MLLGMLLGMLMILFRRIRLCLWILPQSRPWGERRSRRLSRNLRVIAPERGQSGQGPRLRTRERDWSPLPEPFSKSGQLPLDKLLIIEHTDIDFSAAV